MDRLDELESKSIYIIREANHEFSKLGVLWSIGKDSTTLVWLCRKAFFGVVPFPVVHIDTSYKFPEIYRFRDQYAKEWGLDLVIGRNDAALAAGMNHASGMFQCCAALKTEALRQTIQRHGFSAILLGIRRDEHGIRAKERYFSPRDSNFAWNYQDQPPELWDLYKSREAEDTHFRIHPLLHWSELEIWEYVRREGIPINPLYFAVGGQRYRSIGCQTCCHPVASTASDVNAIVAELQVTTVSERSGRSQDKESAYTMQKLRALGYM